MSELAAEPSPSIPEAAPRPKRVPGHAIVPIGAAVVALSRPRSFVRRGRPVQTANDNHPRPKSTLLRELIFLAILGATLYGAYETGRANAYHRIIVVPESQNVRATVT